MNVPEIVQEIREAVEKIAERHGVAFGSFSFRKVSGDQEGFTFRAAVTDPLPDTDDDAVRSWHLKAWRLGMDREWLGRTFTYREWSYVISGLLVDPFLRVKLRRSDGETSTARIDTLIEIMGGDHAEN